ncbi:MAG: DUF4445 domain-containing protein [Anaerolineae bacterium]|nr:DUF4445 domain-containing protein [Anaerolineae bacterium]
MALSSKDIQVDFQPVGKRVTVAKYTTLLESAIQAGIDLASACGGMGLCGQCRVRLLAGDATPPNETEQDTFSELELARGDRLACCTEVEGDVRVHIPRESLLIGQRLQVEGDDGALQVDPLVRAFEAIAPPPTLSDPRADLARIVAALQETAQFDQVIAEPEVLDQLSPVARAENWQITAFLRGQELVGIAPAGSHPLGFAVDLGTTKVAGYLVDLSTGGELARGGVLNAQIGYGEDVISRLAYAHRNPDGRHHLANMIRESLDELLGELVAEAGVNRNQIVDACIVGNTAMTHLLLELPIRQLAVAPYVAATDTSVEIKARTLGLETAPGAWVYVPSSIGGYVGADHVAMIMATGLDEVDRVTMGIDIGTNSEIVLRQPGRAHLASASCASGPAFEGAHISDGMRAASGAIEVVHLTENGADIKTVDDAPAVGLCGSGIIDAVAEVYRWHLINGRGRFQADSQRVRHGRQGLEFLLVDEQKSGSGRDVVITQHDVNEIQLAKGAIRAGLEVLLEATGTAPEAVEEVIIAGAFGSYLDIQSAKAIGLFPEMPNAHFRQVGNAAGVGAKQMLLSREARVRAERLAAGADYVELTVFPKFNRKFAMAMLFPELNGPQE